MIAPDRIWVTGGHYWPDPTFKRDKTEYIRADMVPQWMTIDEITPIDIVLLLGWRGYGDKWETATDYWHNSRGGWRHGNATHYQIITPPPAI